MYILLYFDKTQNVNVNLLISARRLTSTAQNTSTLRFAFRQSKATDPPNYLLSWVRYQKEILTFETACTKDDAYRTIPSLRWHFFGPGHS